MNPRSRQFTEQFISPGMSTFLTELSLLMKKHDVTLQFEAETVEGSGSMLTVQKGHEIMPITVESPYALDLDCDLIGTTLNDVMIF